MHVAIRRSCLAGLAASVLCAAGCASERRGSSDAVRASASASCAGTFAIAHLALPYCTNRSLRSRDARVRRLVIVVHGTQRNASDYQRFMVDAARAARVRDALIVAPHFLD